ncbi:hypothetical protein [Micrococcus cohnii]|uniref:SMI1/KNR4 family protein n=1 Tax=Micrococcus cohnii TaxID=993416 RepID=A0A7W7GPB4_9MICC|nr:hypothetical protein [Micrococcus cohnii]MBB4735790.1 hypothetical protein [Micrococcus cohnii]
MQRDSSPHRTDSTIVSPEAVGAAAPPRPTSARVPDPAEYAACRSALAVFGPVGRQEPIEWAAEEPLAPELAAFYRHVGPGWIEIDTLGLPLMFFPLDRLWDEQAGYRWSRRTGARLVDWNDDWTVVAKQGAEPFIHEASTGRVLMAPGDDGWEDRQAEPEPVFQDVLEMTRALAAVGAAWARFDDPFTPDWSLTHEVLAGVVAGIEAELGDHARAVSLARALGYVRAV